MLRFKTADQPHEFEQIHQLNYRTFVEEIPQHQPDPSQRLVDRFHDENTYVICLRDSQLLGMLALRTRRPFSLDAKVPHLDAHLPPSSRICEVRLLAIEPRHRKGRILAGLLRQTWRQTTDWGCDLAIISGTTRQARLYLHLGFIPFGPLVGSPGAYYQPMYATRAALGGVTLRLNGNPTHLVRPAADTAG
jgi:hypothetical protein